MNIERTTDIDFIVKCVMASYDLTSDDSSPPKDLWFPPIHQGVIWVRAADYGVFCLTKMHDILYEVHTVLLPCAKGKAVEIGKAALQWAWQNTAATRIVTNVPAFNPLALRLAKQVGFEVYGVNVGSFIKNGIKYDQVMLGINNGGI